MKLTRKLAQTPRRKGFTLIELLVVISIIATLVALVAPPCRVLATPLAEWSAKAISRTWPWRSRILRPQTTDECRH